MQNILVESAIRATLAEVESIKKNVDVKIKMVKTFKALLQIDEVEHPRILTKKYFDIGNMTSCIKQVECVEVSKDCTF